MIIIWLIFIIAIFTMFFRITVLNGKIAEAMDKKVFDSNFKSNVLKNVIMSCIIIVSYYGFANFSEPFNIVNFIKILCSTIRYNLFFLCLSYYLTYTSRRKKDKDKKENIFELKITISLTMSLVILNNILSFINKESFTSILIFNIVAMIAIFIYSIKKCMRFSINK